MTVAHGLPEREAVTRRRRGLPPRPVLGVALALGYLLFLWQLTLTYHGPSTQFEPAGNAVPFRSLKETLLDSPGTLSHKLFYLVGNLVLLIPILPLWLLLTGRWLTTARATVIALAVSATVETAQWQLIAGRAGDIDDVFLNTTGCLVAAVAGRWAMYQAAARRADQGSEAQRYRIRR